MSFDHSGRGDGQHDSHAGPKNAASADVLCFPPSPNWFNGQAVASYKNVVVYAAKNDVVFLWMPDESQNFPLIRQLSTHFDRAKAVAVDIINDADGEKESDGRLFLAVTSEDGVVRVWKVADRPEAFKDPRLFKDHELHKEQARDRFRVPACAWCPHERGLLYSADENGRICRWQTEADPMATAEQVVTDGSVDATRSAATFIRLNMGKQSITSMRASPHHANVLAFGCKFGLLFVANVAGKGQILHKIRAHDEDIQAISWCPVKGNPFTKSSEVKEGENEDVMLAVASRDRSFTFWSTATSAKVAHLSLIKPRPMDPKHSWNTLKWIEANTLISNGTNGELIQWNLTQLKKTTSGLYQGDDRCSAAKLLHQEHLRHIFGLAFSTNGVAFSIGQDRSVVGYQVHDQVIKFNLPAFAAWIYAIEPHPMVPSFVAIAGGDGCIRLWKSDSKEKCVDYSFVHQKLNTVKVTALAWDPQRESSLYIGTDDGRIARVDAFKPKKAPEFLSLKHRGQVYRLCFGPSLLGGDSQCLYSVADSKIVMHSFDLDVPHPNMNIDDLIDKANGLDRKSPKRSELAIHPNGLLAVGSEDGSVEIICPKSLKILSFLQTFSKLIQSLAWRPLPPHGKEKDFTLAVASNEHDIHIFYLEDSINTIEANSTDVEPSLITAPSAVLSGHHLRVIQVCWSPHDAHMLASVSYDETAQVWDVTSKKGIGNFPVHSGRIGSVAWSPTDPDVVLTGSEDCSLRGWRVSQLINTLPVKKATKKLVKKMKPKKEEANVHLLSSPRVANGHSESDNSSLVEVSLEKNVKGSGKPFSPEKLKEKQLFSQSYKMEMARKGDAPAECLTLLSVLKEEPAEDHVVPDKDQVVPDEDQAAFKPSQLHLKIYGTSKDIEEVLSTEVTSLMERGLHNEAVCLGLFHGDCASHIRACIEKGHMTEAMALTAASVSRQLWLECVAALAKKAEGAGDYLRAATHLVMIDKVKEAVDVLQKGCFFKTALTLAKSRLSISHPGLDKEVLKAWSRQAKEDGNLEVAARCAVAAGETLAASEILAKRGRDGSALTAAARLAEAAGETGRAKVLAAQAKERLSDGFAKKDISGEADSKKGQGTKVHAKNPTERSLNILQKEARVFAERSHAGEVAARVGVLANKRDNVGINENAEDVPIQAGGDQESVQESGDA